MDPGLIREDSDVKPKAPGMKYRHYAPKASLSVVEGEEEEVIAAIRKMTAEDLRSGIAVGIIAAEETCSRYPEGLIKCIGSRKDEDSIGRRLYQVLREFDQSNVEKIYSEAFYSPHLGQAVMNRLLKAAGHSVIQAGAGPSR